MDKLQPILKQHFWILAGLVLPLVMYGFYSANGQLSAATQARQETLQKTLSGVSPGREPNTDYVKKLELINGFLGAAVDDTIVEIWRRQQARMTWPALVAQKIPQEFLGEFDQQVPFIYKSAYEEAFQKLEGRVQPVQPVDPMVRQPASGAGVSNQKVILAATLPQANFGQFGVTSQEMWDAQIDLWMTALLLDAIVDINKEKDSVSEAVIRRLNVLQLMGGTGTPTTSDANAGGQSGEMGGMPPGGMGGPTGPAMNASVAFPVEQEFGPSVEGGGQMSGSMEMGGVATVAPPRRYIGDTEGKNYLERGFYMSVIIMQNKIPDFLVELANSDWPVQVRRFQVGVNPYRTTAPASEMIPGSEYSSSPDMYSGSSMESSSMPMSYSSPGMNASGMPMQGAARPNKYATNLPKFATDALNHPDLVQLDLCGIITMYKQPVEIMAAVETRKQAEAEAQKAAASQQALETPAPETAPMQATTPMATDPMTTDPMTPAPAAEIKPVAPLDGSVAPETPAAPPAGTPAAPM